MKNMFSKPYRFTAALLALVLLVLALPWPVAAAGGIWINIVSVKQNSTVTVEAVNFPKDTTWTVRIGPYYTFGKDNETVDTITTSAGGTFKFTVNLPDNLKNDGLVAIRVESNKGHYAYNAFYNNDANQSPNKKATPKPTDKVTTPIASGGCTLVSVSPTSSKSMSTGNDFDAVWTVKNTGDKTWDTSNIDYKYMSGEKMHQGGSAFDLTATVKPGETTKIIVDMLAPGTPGTYTAYWAMVYGSSTMCNLPVTIRVK